MLPPFGWEPAISRWQFAPVVTGFVVIAAALYLWGTARVARRHPARPWPLWRTGMFLGGLAVVVVATQSGIGVYDDVLFWDHMIQHLMLIMIAPPLLIVGQPVTLLLHASRNPLHSWAKRVVRSRAVSFLTWPVLGFLAYAGAIVAAHLTGLANLVETNDTVHNAEHAAFLLIGYLFFLPILGREPIRWRLSYPARFVILVLVMPVDTFTGLVLGYGNAGTPGVPVGPRPAWAPGSVQDLHWGGAIMWVGGDAIMFGLMMLVFLAWSRDERPAATGRGWFEAARRASMGSLIATHPAPSAATAGTGNQPDASQLAGGQAAGDQPSGDQPSGDQPGGSQPATGDLATAGDWSGRGGIDDDEHLAAYNAFLARLNESEPGRRR
jgi:cytochrome c oxidase assembly factor CtaG